MLWKLVREAVFICAYRSMEEITNDLITVGEVDRGKIYPLITDHIVNYDIGDLNNYNWEQSLVYYMDAARVRNICDLYNNNRLKVITPKTDDWFCGKRMISHACGGKIKNREIVYSNTREAFETTIENHFGLVECDVLKTDSNGWMLGNDKRLLHSCMKEGLTIMPVKDYIELIEKSDIISLIDVKWRNTRDYEEFVDELNKIIGNNESLKQKIVLEVYDEDTIRIAKNSRYQTFFTQYRNKYCFSVYEIVDLCNEYDIKVVGFNRDWTLKHTEYIKNLSRRGAIIYVFSVDSIDTYYLLREMGVYGVFTNFMTPKNT